MIKAFILALQFLTRLPIPIQIDVTKKTLARGTFFYPFIGMLIGGIGAVIYVLIAVINTQVASILAVFTLIAVTGGLHLDGLSDMADGFFSARPKERILEIMKDSRVGAFGVVAIVFNILIKYILISEMNHNQVVLALILSCGIGRVGTSMLFSFGKSARTTGLGHQITNNGTRLYFLVSVVLFSIIGFMMANVSFIIALAAVLLFCLALIPYCYRVIGGLTGDIYGAACELGEIISLFSFLVVNTWILL